MVPAAISCLWKWTRNCTKVKPGHLHEPLTCGHTSPSHCCRRHVCQARSLKGQILFFFFFFWQCVQMLALLRKSKRPNALCCSSLCKMAAHVHNVLRCIGFILVRIQLAGISSGMGKTGTIQWMKTKSDRMAAHYKGLALFSGKLRQY